jgi:hypothetical protein
MIKTPFRAALIDRGATRVASFVKVNNDLARANLL